MQNTPLTTDKSKPNVTFERIQILDILRGMALMGIMMVHFVVGMHWLIASPEQKALMPFPEINAIIGPVIDFFFTDKSRTLFAFMFGIATEGQPLLTTLAIIKVAVVVPSIVLFHWFMRETKVLDVAYKMSWWSLSIVWSTLILLLIWAQESGSSFIYFQF